MLWILITVPEPVCSICIVLEQRWNKIKAQTRRNGTVQWGWVHVFSLLSCFILSQSSSSCSICFFIFLHLCVSHSLLASLSVSLFFHRAFLLCCCLFSHTVTFHSLQHFPFLLVLHILCSSGGLADLVPRRWVYFLKAKHPHTIKHLNLLWQTAESSAHICLYQSLW